MMAHGHDGTPSQPTPSQQHQPVQEVIQPRQQPAQPEPVVPAKPVPSRPDIVLPPEPEADDEGSLELIFRMPVSGERIRRRFLKDETIQVLYDFVDDLQNKEKCQFEGLTTYEPNYQILQSMPRKVYSDKEVTLESVGFYPRGAMLQIQ